MQQCGWKPRAVSFSSGGVRALGQLGILAKLLDSGVLDEVRDWYGCSGGALNAYIGALGASTAWIRDVVAHFDMRPIGAIDGNEVAELFQSWGVRRGEAYRDYVGRFLETWEPSASSWTFAEFAVARPGVGLHFIGTNISRGTQVVFDVEHTPSVRILDAIQASGAIPGFFTPWTSPEGDMICDGAIIEYYPWMCVPIQTETLVIDCEDFGIHGREVRMEPVNTFGEYMRRVIHIATQKRHIGVSPRYWIALNMRDVSMLDFTLTKEMRLALFESGARAASGWLAFRSTAASAGCTAASAGCTAASAGCTAASAGSTAASAGTPQNPPVCEGPCKESSDHPSPTRKLDNPEYQSPPQPAFPSRGSHTPSIRSARRWSL